MITVTRHGLIRAFLSDLTLVNTKLVTGRGNESRSVMWRWLIQNLSPVPKRAEDRVAGLSAEDRSWSGFSAT